MTADRGETPAGTAGAGTADLTLDTAVADSALRAAAPEADILVSNSAADIDAAVLAAHDDEDVVVIQALFDGDDIAGVLGFGGGDDTEVVIEDDAGAGLQTAERDLLGDGHAHLAARRGDVDDALEGVDGAQVGAKAERGRSEPVDLLAQARKLQASGGQGVGEAGILARELVVGLAHRLPFTCAIADTAMVPRKPR